MVPTVERGFRRRGLLVDGHGRREALDEVDVRLVHLAQELPGIGGQRLDVAALALGEDGVEGEGGLAGAGQAGEHDHGIARQVQVHVAQVVLAGTLDDEARHVRTLQDGAGRGRIPDCQRLDDGMDFNGWIFSYSFRHESNANLKTSSKTIPRATGGAGCAIGGRRRRPATARPRRNWPPGPWRRRRTRRRRRTASSRRHRGHRPRSRCGPS